MVSEDGHFVYKGGITVFLVVCENWSCIEISDSFGFVVVVIDPVKFQLRRIYVLACEFFEFRAKLFAAMAMLGVMIDNLVIWLVSFLFVFQASDRN